MEVRWRVAMGVTALKLLLVPAYRSTDFEASRHSRCEWFSCASAQQPGDVMRVQLRMITEGHRCVLLTLPGPPSAGPPELDGDHQQPAHQPMVSACLLCSHKDNVGAAHAVGTGGLSA